MQYDAMFSTRLKLQPEQVSDGMQRGFRQSRRREATTQSKTGEVRQASRTLVTETTSPSSRPHPPSQPISFHHILCPSHNPRTTHLRSEPTLHNNAFNIMKPPTATSPSARPIYKRFDKRRTAIYQHELEISSHVLRGKHTRASLTTACTARTVAAPRSDESKVSSAELKDLSERPRFALALFRAAVSASSVCVLCRRFARVARC